MKNSLLIESSLVALGGFVVPLVATAPAHATDVISVGPGVVSVISTALSSHVSGVLITGGGAVAFTNINSNTANSGNTYSGGTVVNDGSTLSIRQDADLGTTTGTLSLGDATTSGVLSLNGVTSGGMIVSSSQISGSLVDGRGILINAGGGTIITNSGTVVSSVTSSGGVNTTATLTSNYSADFAGSISGTGELTVTGGGTLELAGSNYWNGGVLVNGGTTLEISKQANLTSATNAVTLDDGTLAFQLGRTIGNNITLGSGGGTIDTLGHNDTISGIITGPGSLTIATSGYEIVSSSSSTSATSVTSPTSGKLTLTGAETYTGGTVIEGGTLNLSGGSLAGGVTFAPYNSATEAFSGSSTSTTVYSATGELAGSGTVAGAVVVTNGGTVSPGINGSGTLTVGSYEQTSGTTLLINLGSGTGSELLVKGNAALGGDLHLQYNGYTSAGTYHFISAASTTGSFNSTTDNLESAGLKSDVEGGTATITQNSALPIRDLPTLIVAATNAATDDAQFSNELLLDRLQSVRTEALAQRDEVALSDHHEVRNLSPYGLWVSALGGFGSASGGNGAPGYSTSKYGMVLGWDGVMAPGWVDGLAFEYTHQNVSQSGGGTARIGTPRIEAYTGFWRGHYAVDLTLGDGSATISTDRSYAAALTNTLNGVTSTQNFSGSADGSHSANELTAALQFSGNYLLGYKWALSPAAGVKFARLSETGFQETGSDYFNYKVLGQHVNSVRPFVNVQASRRYYFNNGYALVPSVRLGIEDEVGSRNSAVQAQTFGDAYVWTVPGVKPASMSVDADLGLSLETSKRQSFSLKFFGTEASGANDQTIVGQYAIRF
jgi:outer membrane autotransporter protein